MKHPSIYKNVPLVSTATVFILSTVSRVVDLDIPGFTWDELIYYTAGKLYLAGDRLYNIEHPPLIKLLIGLSSYLPIPPEASARLPIAILSIFAVYITYKLTYLLTRSLPASIAASILAGFESNILGYSRLATLDIPVAIFSLVYIYNLYKFYLGDRSLHRRVYIILSLVLGFLTKYEIIIVLLISIVIPFLVERSNHSMGISKVFIDYAVFILTSTLIYILAMYLIGFDPFSSIATLLNIHRGPLIIPTPLTTFKEFLVKFTPTYQLILLISIYDIIREGLPRSLRSLAILLILNIFIYTLFRFTGIRFQLLSILLLNMLIGYSISRLGSRHLMIYALIILFTLNTLMIHPYYLSYVNQFYWVTGHEYLTDSDLGWGSIIRYAVGLVSSNLSGSVAIVTNYAPHIIEYYTQARVYVIGRVGWGYPTINSLDKIGKGYVIIFIYSVDGSKWNYTPLLDKAINEGIKVASVSLYAEEVDIYYLVV